jgi:beta-galactosidase
MKSTLFLSALMIIAVNFHAFSFTRASEVKIRKAENISVNWKFFKGSPTGTASDNTYNDASWAAVCVPHSIDYTEPTQAAEAASYAGLAWYRKQIQVSGGTEKKYFLEFHGAMQTANVWVNGVKAGTHDNSGYTGFTFDITGLMGNATTAACAVQLDNTRNADIPPGRTGNAPDFFLFSGLYREVWLVTTNKVYIPFCGQFITTPTATATSGTVRVRTTVKNELSAAANCTIVVSLRDQSNLEVGTKTATTSIPANGSYVFDLTSDPITGPKLWSPETPNLYHAYTTISTGTTIVDDYAATFGFRTFSWSSTNGFSLNGSRCPIQGICEHQSFAWVQNAVPSSRWPIEMALIKDAGYNAIRCSHYPRDPAFYDAADSVGMLLEVEVPTWGYGQSSYSAQFWTRLDNCAQEMVVQGFNHPSIFLWGMFNEPFANFSAAGLLPAIAATIHGLDNSRPTIMANNSQQGGNVTMQDVIGLNYQTVSSFGLPNPQNYKFVTTEYFEGWVYNCNRGMDCETKFSDDGWNSYQNITNQPQQMAGQFLWVFNDYKAPWNQNMPMGIVDEYRLPKKLYYRFRKAFTGKPADTAVAGAAAKIVLTPDLARLKADGSDFTIVTASLRDVNNGLRYNKPDTSVTFAITGPATAFGPLTRGAAAGKTAIILRATTAPGAITVTANVNGLPQAQASIVSDPPPVTEINTGMPGLGPHANNIAIIIGNHGAGIRISACGERMDRVTAVDLNGRTIGVWNGATSVFLTKHEIGHTVCIVQVKKNGMTAAKKITLLTE